MYRPLALLVIVSLVLAGTFTGAGRSASANSSNAGEPAGQLTRRGVTGEVVSAGGGSIVIETKFGNVTIGVPDGTIIKSKGETITLEDINPGDKAGVLLDKAPDVLKVKDSDEDGEDGDVEDVDLSAPSTGDDTGTDPDLTPTPVSDDTGVDPDLTPTPEADDTGTDPEPTATPTPTPTLTPPDPSDDTGTEPDLAVPSNLNDTGTEPDLAVPSNLDDTGTEPDAKPPVVESFRQDVTALRITIVPAKATR